MCAHCPLCCPCRCEQFAVAEELKVTYEHVFSVESAAACRAVIDHNHKPQIMLPDATDSEAVRALPSVDLVAAGFPCQPFSLQGLRAGWADKRLRGLVVFGIIAYLHRVKPRVFFLENVQGLLSAKHAEFFHAVMTALRNIKDGNNKRVYRVAHRVLNTNRCGIPQNRPRVYIVGIHSAYGAAFHWPSDIEPVKLTSICRGKTPPRVQLPPNCQVHAQRAVLEIYNRVLGAGCNPLSRKVALVIDCDAATPNFMLGQSPCITASRASNSGFWLAWLGRRMKTSELLALQGMDERRVLCPPSCSSRSFQHMIGNAFSQNVVTLLLANLLRAAQLVEA